MNDHILLIDDCGVQFTYFSLLYFNREDHFFKIIVVG